MAGIVDIVGVLDPDIGESSTIPDVTISEGQSLIVAVFCNTDGAEVDPIDVRWGGPTGQPLELLDTTERFNDYYSVSVWLIKTPTPSTSSVFAAFDNTVYNRVALAVVVEDADVDDFIRDLAVAQDDNVGAGQPNFTVQTAALNVEEGDLVLTFSGIGLVSSNGVTINSIAPNPPLSIEYQKDTNDGFDDNYQGFGFAAGAATGSTIQPAWNVSIGTNNSFGYGIVSLAVKPGEGAPPAEAAELTSPTPSGTIETGSVALIGNTTDIPFGTYYAIADEASLSGITPEEIEAGMLPGGSTPALASGSASVTSSSPSVLLTGLSTSTAYNRAAVQKVGSTYSNVSSGSFTTADAAPVPEGVCTIDDIDPRHNRIIVDASYDDDDQLGFEYQINGGSWIDIGQQEPSGFTFTVFGLTPEATYDSPGLRIRAYNIEGGGTPSDAEPFTTTAVPAISELRSWRAIGSNVLADINPEANSELNPNYPSAAPWHGSGGQPSVILHWNGGTIRQTDEGDVDYLIGPCGGHGDYFGSEIYRMRLAIAGVRVEEPEWEILHPPAVDPDLNDADGWNDDDGDAISRHTYGYTLYDRENDQLVLLGGVAMAGNGAVVSSNVHAFDFTSGEWIRNAYTQVPSLEEGSLGNIFFACQSADGKLHRIGELTRAWATLDTQEDEWAVRSSIFGDVQFTIDCGCYDPVRDRIILMGGSGVSTTSVVVVSNSTGLASVQATTNAPANMSSPTFGVLYDAELDCYVGWNGGATLYDLDPETWEWAERELLDQDVQPSNPTGNGTYNRFAYIADCPAFPGGAYAIVNAVNQPVYLFAGERRIRGAGHIWFYGTGHATANNPEPPEPQPASGSGHVWFYGSGHATANNPEPPDPPAPEPASGAGHVWFYGEGSATAKAPRLKLIAAERTTDSIAIAATTGIDAERLMIKRVARIADGGPSFETIADPAEFAAYEAAYEDELTGDPLAAGAHPFEPDTGLAPSTQYRYVVEMEADSEYYYREILVSTRNVPGEGGGDVVYIRRRGRR